MRRARGITLVEVLLATLLTAIIVGTLTSLYVFVVNRAAHAAADVSTTHQVQALSGILKRNISSAVSCEVVTAGGNTGLKCIMPVDGVDKDTDGYFDSYSPNGVSRRGIAKFGSGKRIWFYFADTTGNFAVPGKLLWKAVRTDDALPTAADVDNAFTYYYGSGKETWNLIESVTFVTDSSRGITSYSINSSSLTRTDMRKSDAVSITDADSYTADLSRTIYWRHWRK